MRLCSHIEPIRDNLAGTDVYGTYVADDRANATFSVPFSALLTPATELLFMTGDRSEYLVVALGSIVLGRVDTSLPSTTLTSGPQCLFLIDHTPFSFSAGGVYSFTSLPRDPIIGNRFFYSFGALYGLYLLHFCF
jgi:hypothetical protein